MLHSKQLGFSDQQIAKLTDSEFFEVLFYATDQLTNRNAIEANLSNKYGISLS